VHVQLPGVTQISDPILFVSDYQNLSTLSAQVLATKSRPSLLLWYTADEPDGTSDPISATLAAATRIRELDSGYHPVSLVLNCFDFYFSHYAGGGAADIVLQDTYPIDSNATWSAVYNTEACDSPWYCAALLPE
jgi:hypothetical protein